MKNTFFPIWGLKAVALALLYFFSFTEAKAQVPFIQELAAFSVVMNTDEQTKFNQIQSQPNVASVSHIALNPIQNYLQGINLTVQLPEGGGSLTFVSDYVMSLPNPNGEYHWVGANANGSTIRIGKYGTEYLGNLYVAATTTHYAIMNLSASKLILVKYVPGAFEVPNECDTPDDEEQDPNDGVTDRAGCERNTIRVLVLFTTASTTAASGFRPLIVGPAVIAELNATTVASGLSSSDIRFTLAGIALLPGFFEAPANALADVIRLSTNTAAIAMRNTVDADLVLLLTDDVYVDVFGIERAIAASSELAFAISEIAAAATGFTASHEIGHLIGAHHQRCSFCPVPKCSEITNAHGYLISQNFSTIMRQKNCEGGGRIGRWSNPDMNFMGLPTGTPNNNNAKRLKDRAGKVSCFRGTSSSIPYEVTLSTSTYICDGIDTLPMTAIINGFASPASIIWDVSNDGVSEWQAFNCTGAAQCTGTGLFNRPNVFFVRVTVCDAQGNCASDMRKVTKLLCFGGGGEDRKQEVPISPIIEPMVFPNPAEHQIVVRGLEPNAVILLSDVSGKILLSMKSLAPPRRARNAGCLWHSFRDVLHIGSTKQICSQN